MTDGVLNLRPLPAFIGQLLSWKIFGCAGSAGIVDAPKRNLTDFRRSATLAIVGMNEPGDQTTK